MKAHPANSKDNRKDHGLAFQPACRERCTIVDKSKAQKVIKGDEREKTEKIDRSK